MSRRTHYWPLLVCLVLLITALTGPAPALALTQPNNLVLVQENLSARYGETVTLQVAVKHRGNNRAMPDLTVEFLVDGQPVGTAVTNSSGTASLDLLLALPAGTYTVEALIRKEHGNIEYRQSATLTVSQQVAALSLSDVRATVGGTALLTGRLNHSATGTPLGGKTVYFTVDGTGAGSAVTGDDGSASIEVPVSMAPGTYPLAVAFRGDDTTGPASATATLTVEERRSTLRLQPCQGRGPERATWGWGVNLWGCLTNESGAGVPGKTVSFVVDGAVVGAGVTDAWGMVIVNYVSHLKPGSYPFEMKFDGDAVYGPTRYEGRLPVDKANADVSYNRGIFTREAGVPAMFRSHIYYTLGDMSVADYIKIGPVTFKLLRGGQVLEVQTVNPVSTSWTGLAGAEAWFAPQPAGTYTLQISIDSEWYSATPSSDEFIFE